MADDSEQKRTIGSRPWIDHGSEIGATADDHGSETGATTGDHGAETGATTGDHGVEAGATAGIEPGLDGPRRAVAATFRDALAYAREREYRGWDYCDGMSSRLRRALPFETRVTNLLFQEGIKRSPVNVRPYLLVEQRRNYAGAGLFAMANVHAHRLGQRFGRTDLGDVDYAAEATSLADWIVDNRCRGYSGFCGSHGHRIQHLGYRSDVTDPSIVSTVFPAEALLSVAELESDHGSDTNRDYAAVARTAADFVVEDLDYRPVDGGARIDYNVHGSSDHYTINGGALAARLFLALYERFGDATYRERATALLDYIATLQTDRGGWAYRHPSSASHLSMDNFHNGFVIESFLRYARAVDPDRYAETIDRALGFYRTALFEPDGAPNHDESSQYPKDIHDVAEGLILFGKTGQFEFAQRVFDWGVENLSDGEGRFYHRRDRWYTRRYTLMRWSQAWMSHALGTLLVEWTE